MQTIDWKRKLTSRKLWVALCELVTALIVLFGGDQETATKITAVIMLGATVMAYILAEGMIDAASAAEDSLTEER